MFVGSTQIVYIRLSMRNLKLSKHLIATSFFEERPLSSCLVMLCPFGFGKEKIAVVLLASRV
jgi:hypothetical protein